MNRAAVIELLETINSMYPGRIREDNFATTLSVWSSLLAKHDESTVFDNLAAHAETSTYPPTISDLLKKPEKSTVPGYEETMKRFEVQGGREPADPKVAEAELAKIREMLGVKRDG